MNIRDVGMYPDKRGMTLMEILIVVALIMLISAGFLTNWYNQVERGRDAKKKRDLATLQRAMEEYSNDNGCYPDSATYTTFSCGSTVFEPYGIKEFPCNDDTNQRYTYETATTSSCDGFRLVTTLKGKGDPDIERVGCTAGCTTVGGVTFNYGVSTGIPLIPVPGP